MQRVNKVVDHSTTANQTRESADEFHLGMYVRVPLDIEDTPIPGEHRDFCIGQITKVDSANRSAQIQVLEPYDDHRLRPLKINCRLAFVRRCALAPTDGALAKWTTPPAPGRRYQPR